MAVDFPFSALVHFILVEMRAVYLYYFTFRMMTFKFAYAAELQRQLNAGSGVIAWDPECVYEGINNAQFKVWLEADDEHLACYRRTAPGYNAMAVWHYIILVCASIYVVVPLICLLRNGARSWQSGKYLAFTYELEHTMPYKISAWLLVAFTGAALTVMLLYAGGAIQNQTPGLSAKSLWDEAWLDMLAIVLSAWAFIDVPDPALEWHDQKLLESKFEWPWYYLLLTSTDEMANKLEEALLRKHCGSGGGALERIAGRHLSLWDAPSVARVCRAPQQQQQQWQQQPVAPEATQIGDEESCQEVSL